MVPIPCLEIVRCEADVCFCCVFGCDRGLVHDFIHHTFTHSLYIYIIITNDDDDETPQIPFTPIFRPHSVIFFRVTNKQLTCYTFKLLNCQGNARA